MQAKKKSAPGRRVMKPSERSPIWPLPSPDEGKSSNGARYEYQRIKNPQTADEREKMLAKREALTLKAFRIAYENNHQRKAS